MSSFGKNSFINKDFNSCISSKYLEDSCMIVFVAVSIFSERLTDTSCQDSSLLFLTFLWLTNMKNVLRKNIFFFQRTGLSFFYFCHLPCYLLVCFCFKQRVVHCVLSVSLICVMLRIYMLIFLYTFEFFESQALCYHYKHWN